MNQFDFETLADASPIDLGTPYDPSHTVLAGAQLHLKTAPCILEALEKRVHSGLFGWTASDVPQYLDAICRWMKQVRAWDIQKDWIVPSYGTLQAISAAIRAFTNRGDGVIVQPPVYVLYDRVLNNTGRKKVCNPLIYKDGQYSMDFNGLETLMANPENKLMILCNPHNPIMDYWEEKDLKKVAHLAKQYGVLVIADEIFAEHVFSDTPMTPYATVEDAADNCIICTSLGKSFNFTGTSHANIIIPDQHIRDCYRRQRDEDHYGSLSPFLYTSLLAAYTPEGKAWIDALLEFVGENIRFTKEFFETNFPLATVCRHRAGSLIWVDLRPYGSQEQIKELFARAKISVDDGSQYGEGGTGFVRIQLGIPREELTRTLPRLLKAAQEMKMIK